MLQLDPSARFSMEEIFAHPWINGPVPTHNDIQKQFRLRIKRSNAIEDTEIVNVTVD